MISEVAFARDFASFWRSATPTMDGFVRRLNKGVYTRDSLPMYSKTAASRRSFVNEVAFAAFCESVERNRSNQLAVSINDLTKEATKSVAGIVGNEDDIGNTLSKNEANDAAEQIRRLHQRLSIVEGFSSIECRPIFPGCGIVDKCEGDIAIGGILFEIKAGDRPFRSVDLRQLLTYLTLNYAGGSRSFRAVGLVNPRVGISFEMGVDEFCFEVGGRHPTQLFEFIAYSLSSGDVSR